MPKDLEEIPKELGKCCEYRDFKALPFSTLDQTIAAWLEVHSDENTYIYFLNNRDRMTAVEELFNKETADFDNVLTLKMAYTTYAKKFKKDKRFKNYNIKNDKDNEDTQNNTNDTEINNSSTKITSNTSDYSSESTNNKQEQSSDTNSNKQTSTDDSDSATKNNTNNISGFSFNEFFSDDEDNSKESEKPDKTNNTPKREKNNKQPIEDDFDPLDNMEFEPPPSSIVHDNTPSSESSEAPNNPNTGASARTDDDKEYNQRKQGKPSGLKKPSNTKNKPQEPEDNRTLEEIEKEIFGDEKKYKKIEKVYTELDLSKMKTVDLYLERLINGIKKYCKKDADGNINIDYNNFIEFIMILLKAENYDDFIKSWEVISSFDISLTEEEYTFIKEEAEYYAEVCNLFYGKDKW